MGARPDDYKRLAPPQSYIHVDDFESPKELAEYLLELDKDDHRYNSYFLWKGSGTFIDTKFWCRLCALIHESHTRRYHVIVTQLDDWWRGDGVCQKPYPSRGQLWTTWRHQPATVSQLFYQSWTDETQLGNNSLTTS